MKKLTVYLLIVSLLFPLISSLAYALENYTCAPDDLLEVKILNQKDMDTKQAIAPDSSVSYHFTWEGPRHRAKRSVNFKPI